jgi:large conductance mechanosensitive channel
MPPIGLLLGGVDFTDLKLILKEGTEGVDPVTLNYGFFIQQVIDFIIIAFAVFMVVKLYQSTQRKRQEVPPAVPIPTNEEKLLAEIRDLLKKQTP